MLYLAEVQKQGTGFMGRAKAELRLLACQQSESNWEAVRGEEMVAADEATNLGAGTLVLVDIGKNKQVQRLITDTPKQLVSILQNFSRQQKEFKRKEEEIEQWRHSLEYQSNELNLKVMEMEAERQEFESLREEADQIKQQREEAEAIRQQAVALQEELDRQKQELEGAWAHLRGETMRLEERKGEAGIGGGLDQAQLRSLQELIDRLSSAVAPTDALREQLNASFELMTSQQNFLAHHWQELEQQRNSAQTQQATIDQAMQTLQANWETWHAAQAELNKLQQEITAQEQLIAAKQNQAEFLTLQLEEEERLYRQINQLIDPLAEQEDDRVDVEALRTMPLGELQAVVAELQRELERSSQFVNDQEEELRLQQQAIEELQEKLANTNEIERLNLETQIADEQESYQMLNESLVGSRRNLQERQEIFHRHQAILNERQGIYTDAAQSQRATLEPLLAQVDSQRQRQTEVLQHLESEIEQMRAALQQSHDLLEQQLAEQSRQQAELMQQEEALQAQRVTMGELWGKVNLYQEALQPLQDQINSLREKLESLAGGIAQVQEVRDQQLQVTESLRQALSAVAGEPVPEFVNS
ncbi:pilus motility taxis protein HmpF [Trichothermofontia sp.]